MHLDDLEEHCSTVRTFSDGAERRAPKKAKFGAFWHLKIASKECNVAVKLYERVYK